MLVRKEAEEILAILTLALDALDEVGRLRAEVSMARARLVTIIEAEEKTPARPPSTAAMAAFVESSKFKKPKG
jgi:hypothetical protein